MSGEIFNPGSLPGREDILRRETANGITVLARRNPHSRAVSLTGYLEVGCQVDPEEKLGLANFTAAGLMRGTRQKTHSQIFRQLGPSLWVRQWTSVFGLCAFLLAFSRPA